MNHPKTPKIEPVVIGERIIGIGHPCFVVAEVGQAHDGSLGIAHAYIDAVAETGADCIKFQTHIASEESTRNEQWREKFSQVNESRYEYWERMEFKLDEWQKLALHAKQRGLTFLSSPFSKKAVDLLITADVPAWKIGAGEVGNRELFKYIADTGKPVLISSGMSSWEELDRAVGWLRAENTKYAVYQCTSTYPCPPERLGLNNIQLLRDRYNCPVGLSDHSGQIYAGLSAVTLGANLLEVHVTLSPYCFGPDTTSSITIEELKQLVHGVRFIETAMSSAVDKDVVSEELLEMKRIFGKSLVAVRQLNKGDYLNKEDITCKKPGGGIPASQLESYVGRRLANSVTKDTLFSELDFE